MWEPGAYGMVLGLAIILNLIRNSFRFTASFYVLTITAISTLSTTTYLCMLIISLFILYNKNLNYKFILIPIVIAAFIYTLQQSFVTDKIISSYSQGYDLATKNLNYSGFQHINRFGGFVINMNDFLRWDILF